MSKGKQWPRGRKGNGRGGHETKKGKGATNVRDDATINNVE